MFGSFMYDAAAGLGFMVMTLVVVASVGFCLALKAGMFPELSEKLKKLGKEKDEVRKESRD